MAECLESFERAAAGLVEQAVGPAEMAAQVLPVLHLAAARGPEAMLETGAAVVPVGLVLRALAAAAAAGLVVVTEVAAVVLAF